jgi:N-acetyl-anhydromuramyl-L-alanine amidase AmpD
VRALVVLAVVAGCSGGGGAAAPAPEPDAGKGRGTGIVSPDARASELTIHEWPITWTDERERLMLEYRRLHSDPDATDLTIAPRVVVLHYTAGNSAKGTKGYFDRIRLEDSRAKLKQGGAVNVSAHFLVDRDGTIHRLQPETRMARHCIGLNHIAIGVENVGDGDRWPLTEAQVVANAALIRDLATRHDITHVVGHHEVRAMKDHPYFVERVRGYSNDKPDPGDAFMRDVRALLADLSFRDAATP